MQKNVGKTEDLNNVESLLRETYYLVFLKNLMIHDFMR